MLFCLALGLRCLSLDEYPSYQKIHINHSLSIAIMKSWPMYNRGILRVLCTLCLVLTMPFTQANAQVAIPITRIIFDKEHTAQTLLQKGIAMDHGRVKKGYWFESQFSDEELNLIRSLGYSTEQRMPAAFVNNACETIALVEDPAGFSLGSMAGYFTYSEMLAHLDTLRARFPHLISAKMPVSDSLLSIQGRPIYYVKISDQPDNDEPEKEMLFNALHHAREPGSLSQLMYFMYYLCENYDNDTLIQNIINNSELYFIPCINPDGYIFNQTNSPQGGGMWRKNRRDNGNGTFGVDLNRNYGYFWGYDNNGSSPQSNSDTYRGPSAFSEPETRAVKQFCNQHAFEIALNNHTYGNLLIYPWGYLPSLFTPDSAVFVNMAKIMTAENNYSYGTGDQTVGYVTNGDSDDWMYGEQNEKPKILSMTPEAGDAGLGFWPPQDQILPFCRNMCHMNLETIKLLHSYLQVNPREQKTLYNQNTLMAGYSWSLQGTTDNINASVSLVPVSSNILSVGPPRVYSNLQLFQNGTDSISIQLQPGIAYGDTIAYKFLINNGVYSYEKKVSVLYAQLQSLLVDPCNFLQNWQSTTWGTESPGFLSNSCFSDSPLGFYANNSESVLELSQALNIDSSETIWLSFDATWSIEKGYDYLVVEASYDGGIQWMALCGKYTHPGNEFQFQGAPILDGNQLDWVKEEMPVITGLGDSLLLRFRLVSDAFVNAQGVKVDNINITRLSKTPLGIESVQNVLIAPEIYPNPASHSVFVTLPELVGAGTSLEVISLDGRTVLSKPVLQQKMVLDVSAFSPGMYTIRINQHGLKGKAGKLLVQH